jgi:hypothetical protein
MRDQVPIRSSNYAAKCVVAAIAVAAVLVIVGCGGSSTESGPHSRISELCQQTTDRDADYCNCVADQVIQHGYDTDEEVSQLEPLISAINDSGNLSALPPAVVESLNACAQTAAS